MTFARSNPLCSRFTLTCIFVTVLVWSSVYLSTTLNSYSYDQQIQDQAEFALPMKQDVADKPVCIQQRDTICFDPNHIMYHGIKEMTQGQPEQSCFNVESIGNGESKPGGKGPYRFCNDNNFGPLKEGECLVYSADNFYWCTPKAWSFEIAMAKKGCKVYAFDNPW